jgi:uncharacterized protein
MAPSAGIGWRHPHYAQVLHDLPRVGFLEVHSENFFADGGAALATLAQARKHYGISLHGVGLGLGSAAGIDAWHLDRLARLVERIEPIRVSDHACFARGSAQHHSVHAADLLPIPFNAAALDVLCANVQRVQDRLQRPLLVENLSAYVEMPGSDRSEVQFLNTLTERTGCQLLVDVNNIFVNALNAQALAFDTAASASNAGGLKPPQRSRDAPLAVQSCCAWLDAVHPASVGEIHLAGHCVMDDIVIDDHGSRVCDGVWQVYAHAVQRFGTVSALIEWDTDIPPLQILLDEAARADQISLSMLANVRPNHCAATRSASTTPQRLV